MLINKKEINIKKIICLLLYYSIAQYLPQSGRLLNIGGVIRLCLCKRIFKKCGSHVNIERRAWFGSGANVEIGDYSGIGINCHVPSDTVIGKYVMMGPNCFILDVNHKVSDTTKPMCFQGHMERKTTIIEDDVWIGRDVKMTPGRHIYKGSIIAMGCVLTKDFPEYSIVGGNPSRLLRSRLVQAVSSEQIRSF